MVRKAEVMTPPVKMPVLLSVGAPELHPFHVMSPASLVAFYLSHFQSLSKSQSQPSGRNHQGEPLPLNNRDSQPMALGVIPLNWILNQELGHQDHQIHHQPVSPQEMMAHEWALLDRQLQASPFGLQFPSQAPSECNTSYWPVKPSQSGEAGPSTDMVYQTPDKLNLSSTVSNPFHVGNPDSVQTPLQQVLSETIHQYIWNLMYPGLKKQMLNQPTRDEGLEGESQQDEFQQQDEEQPRRIQAI
jgi:hypothetical protein